MAAILGHQGLIDLVQRKAVRDYSIVRVYLACALQQAQRLAQVARLVDVEVMQVVVAGYPDRLRQVRPTARLAQHPRPSRRNLLRDSLSPRREGLGEGLKTRLAWLEICETSDAFGLDLDS